MRRVWQIRESDPDLAEHLANVLDVHPLVARLLTQREVSTEEEGSRFLSPALSDLHDPGLMKGMDAAVDRLVRAVKAGERLCIYGDYDVDGVTSVSLLSLFLKEVGLKPDYFIPSRLREGYGLNPEAISLITKKGTSLLITVDCGISDVDEIQQAREAGMDVIIIDHHQVPEQLPPASAILDPHQPGCQFPAKDLAAVGVTFNLVMALRSHLRELGRFRHGRHSEEPNLKEYLDLVALGTVADIVPLLGENRIITHFGLSELTAGRRPGVAALKEMAGMLSRQVAVGQVAFRLAPRINAVGRLGEASSAVELLTTNSYSQALHLARELDKANSERQSIEQRILKQAEEEARKAVDHGDKALVLASEEWHPGVIGIVASKLVDRYSRPVVMIALEGERGRGSARGTEQIHLYQTLQRCADDLLGYGGHRAAAGLSIARERVDDFRAAFLSQVEQVIAREPAEKKILVDAEVQLSMFSHQLVEQLGVLAPHGMGNPEPLFVARNLTVKSSRTVGREPPYHLKMAFAEGSQTWDAIGFGMGERINDVIEYMDVLYTPEFNTWEGKVSIQLKLRDIRPAL
jgi:single-stranded-DNA-specific exonuclease